MTFKLAPPFKSTLAVILLRLESILEPLSAEILPLYCEYSNAFSKALESFAKDSLA